MAVIARQRAAIVVMLVVIQAKTSLSSVIKRRSCPVCRGPTIWGMAGLTRARGHTGMRVILIMTARAINWGASEKTNG